MSDQPAKLPAMIFGNTKVHGPGDDSWFWGDLTGKGPADEPNVFPLVLQMGVWSGELTLEQARELRDMRGDEWWSNINFRVIRQYLAEQEDAGGADAEGGLRHGD